MANPIVKRILHKLRLIRPPRHSLRFPGPVLVLGSAPTANLPEGFDDSFTVITVNGAQFHLQHWGVREPDVTFLTWGQIASRQPKATEVRKVLAGHRTGILYVVRWRRSTSRLHRQLQEIPYGYDEVHRLGRMKRLALYETVMGETNIEDSIETRYSNGITAVLYALLNGAREVIIAGIDPGSNGHVHGTAGYARQHSEVDSAVIAKLLARGTKLYTADPEVAERSGVPLWTGRPAST